MAVVLDLVVDATGVQRGSQTAEQALSGVTAAAAKTQSSLTNVGGGLRNTFQAVGGVSQVGQGIAQTADAFGKLNVAVGAFAASSLLLEVGKTAQDFKDMAGTVTVVTRDIYGMTSTTTRAATAFETLRAAVRAHPILTLATVIGAVAGVMALMGKNTDDATKKIDEQAEAMDRLIKKARDLDRAAVYAQPGQKDQRQTTGGTIDALLALRGVPSDTPYYAREAASLFGISEQELRYALARSGLGESALELRYPTHLTGGAALGTSLNPYSLSRFSAGQLVSAGESLLRQRRNYAGYDEGRPFSIIPPQPFGVEDRFGLGIGRNYVGISEAEQREINRDKAQAAADRVAESMERAARSAEQFGGSVGAAAFDVLAGAQGLRQALLSIVSSLGRQGLSSLGSSLFGETVRQVQGNTNPTGGGGNLVLPS